jgi:hypothetical protein
MCGTCGGNEKCSSGQCAACTHSCPTLSSVAQSSSTQCVARLDDCSSCGPSSCGTAHYAYGCWGGDTPPLANCYQYGSPSEFCCSQPACVRYAVGDSYCSTFGFPPHSYSCHLGASIPSGCVLYPSGSDAPNYCCP